MNRVNKLGVVCLNEAWTWSSMLISPFVTMVFGTAHITIFQTMESLALFESSTQAFSSPRFSQPRLPRYNQKLWLCQPPVNCECYSLRRKRPAQQAICFFGVLGSDLYLAPSVVSQQVGVEVEGSWRFTCHSAEDKLILCDSVVLHGPGSRCYFQMELYESYTSEFMKWLMDRILYHLGWEKLPLATGVGFGYQALCLNKHIGRVPST